LAVNSISKARMAPAAGQNGWRGATWPSVNGIQPFCFDPNLKYSHYYDEYELVERLKAKGLLVSYAPGRL